MLNLLMVTVFLAEPSGTARVAVSQSLFADSCPAGAIKHMEALATADTLGVGSFTTESFEGAPRSLYVVVAYHLSCSFASRDSVLLQMETKFAGRIEPLEDIVAFESDTATTVGYVYLLKSGSRWKLLGRPFAGKNMSPAVALRRFDASLDSTSRAALARLAARHR
jgi:hypothetical protein